MDHSTLVTIIVPIYHVEAYLPACVDSLLAQTYEAMQIVLVDDGSPDRCGEICDAYAAKDSRIEVLHKPNGGLGSARNAGLDIARGSYVYFVDSDDTIEPNTVEVTVREMEEHHWDLCAWGLMAFEDSDPSKTYRMGRNDRLEFRFETEQEKSRFFCQYYLTGRVRWEACSRVFRRDLIEQYQLRFGNERQIFAEDLDFSFRYVVHCSSMVCLPDYFYHYRQVGSSIMHTKKWVSRCQQLSCLLPWEQEKIGGIVPYGKSYLHEAVIIATFLGSRHDDYDPIQQAKELRAVLQETENWPYILNEMQLAASDQDGLCDSCGQHFGKYLHALCSYLASGDYSRFAALAEPYHLNRQFYEHLRNMKNSLLWLLKR